MWECSERVFCMECRLFGWNFTALLCRVALESAVERLIPLGFYLFHYLHDDPIVGSNAQLLEVVTHPVVTPLSGAGFVVSGKSTLRPVHRICFRGEVGGLGGPVHPVPPWSIFADV